MLKVQIIVGITREGRNSDRVVEWILPMARRAFEVEVIDLRDWPLPFFQEVVANMGELNNPTYSDPLVQRWNAKIKEADAYLMVTPEYNHGIPAVLKNAIDTVFFSFGFRRKPVAFVGYSLGLTAAVRAVEQLNQVMLETEAVPVRTQTLVPFVNNAFDASGQPVAPVMNVTLDAMLEDLSWLASALKTARIAGDTVPSAFRIRAASGRK